MSVNIAQFFLAQNRDNNPGEGDFQEEDPVAKAEKEFFEIVEKELKRRKQVEDKKAAGRPDEPEETEPTDDGKKVEIVTYFYFLPFCCLIRYKHFNYYLYYFNYYLYYYLFYDFEKT